MVLSPGSSGFAVLVLVALGEGRSVQKTCPSLGALCPHSRPSAALPLLLAWGDLVSVYPSCKERSGSCRHVCARLCVLHITWHPTADLRYYYRAVCVRVDIGI